MSVWHEAWTCEECKTELKPTMRAMRAHAKERHPGARPCSVSASGRWGWTTEPLAEAELALMEAEALDNTERMGTDGDEFCDLSGHVFDLLDEVRRLDAEVERLHNMAPLAIAAQADLPEGTAVLLQPGQIVYMHNLHSEDVVAARKAERERCAAFLRKSAGDGDSVMSDTWAAAVAAEMAALPDE